MEFHPFVKTLPRSLALAFGLTSTLWIMADEAGVTGNCQASNITSAQENVFEPTILQDWLLESGQTACTLDSSGAFSTRKTDLPVFNLIAATWDKSDSLIQVMIRLFERDGWGRWFTLEDDSASTCREMPAHDESAKQGFTAPLFTDGATGFEIQVISPKGLPQNMRVVRINPGPSNQPQTDATSSLQDIISKANPFAQDLIGRIDSPPIILRSQWGADEKLMTWKPAIMTSLKAMTVHHTAGNNSDAMDGAAKVKAVYLLHAKDKKDGGFGWGDIGYHFLVDHKGNIYEGRTGSIQQTVIGGHSYGFNRETMGICGLGNFEEEAPTEKMIDSIAKTLAWKLNMHSVNPKGTVTLKDFSKENETKTVQVIHGHRDVFNTDCPGKNLYFQLDAIRKLVQKSRKGQCNRTHRPVSGWRFLHP